MLYYFLKTIKEQYPETVFHGIDIEHNYETLGVTYLLYLESIGMRESEEYARASSNYEQGRSVYSHDGGIRENYMTENIIYELERLETQDIMGIFGSAHTQLNANAYGYPDARYDCGQGKLFFTSRNLSYNQHSYNHIQKIV